MIFSCLWYTCRSQPIHSLTAHQTPLQFNGFNFFSPSREIVRLQFRLRIQSNLCKIDVVVAKEDTHRLFRGRVVRLEESSTPRVVPCLDSRTELAYFISPLCPSPEQESRLIYVACVI